MSNLLFEISAADVQALDDANSRLLIVKLCESELAAANISPSGLIAGGAQTAPDSGSDVHVIVTDPAFRPGFIPARDSVFQVKAERMPKARVGKEMKPKGTLRPLIAALAAKSGGYVIVSTRDNLTDPSIASRRTEMATVAKAAPGGLTVDFYDAARLVTWINQHPAVALWVRHKLGRASVGWAPFGAWSTSAGEDAFIDDTKARVRRQGEQAALPIADGIAALRASLSTPGSAVRLVGLSGHGKTRRALPASRSTTSTRRRPTCRRSSSSSSAASGGRSCRKPSPCASPGNRSSARCPPGCGAPSLRAQCACGRRSPIALDCCMTARTPPAWLSNCWRRAAFLAIRRRSTRTVPRPSPTSRRPRRRPPWPPSSAPSAGRTPKRSRPSIPIATTTARLFA